MHVIGVAMRDYDEEDPKKPHPIRVRRKRENTPESDEHGSYEVRPDDQGDHRHVIRC